MKIVKSNSLNQAIDQMYKAMLSIGSIGVHGYLLLCTGYFNVSEVDEITTLILSNDF